MTEPLSGIRVVEFASGLAPAYAGKLFVDAGAEVWLVEPPGGDPLRTWSASGGRADGEDGAVFSFLAASKRSVVGQLGDPDLERLLVGADLVLEGLEPGRSEAAGLLNREHLVVTSITAFGRGSWQDRPASELTVQAESGSIAARLYPEGALRAGGRVSEWASGAFAAAASLVAVGHARRGGPGTHIDVSMTEVMCICTNLFLDLMWDLLGRPDLGELGASTEFPAVEPSADGWVGFNTNSAQMFEDFLVLVGRADLAGDPSLRSDPVRREDLEHSTRQWCEARTSEEIVELAALLRVPAVPVGHGANLVENPHLQARQSYAVSPSGFTYPRPPYRLNGRHRPDAGPAPVLGADSDAAAGNDRAGVVAAGDDRTRPPVGAPLSGLKVLDMTCWWAGPGATQLMAALGAEVIHVEAIQRIDGMRPAATLV
ncbi:MAG: CoA transferase, partial [Acidimicrobiales bacterium]